MLVLLKLAGLAAGCLVVVGVPITAVLVWFARRRLRAGERLRIDSIAVLATALTVLSFLVALTCLGCPDDSWLEPNPKEPGNVGVRWSRDAK